MRNMLLGVAVLLASVMAAEVSRAASTIDHYVFSSGGGFVYSATHEAFTIIGEPVVGAASGSTHAVHAGFAAGVAFAGILATPPSDLPAVSRLHAVRPNPFRARTTIAFDLSTSSLITLRVYDTSGRLLRVIANNTFSPGRYSLEWDGTADDGRRMPAGVYYCQFRGGSLDATRRLVYIH